MPENLREWPHFQRCLNMYIDNRNVNSVIESPVSTSLFHSEFLAMAEEASYGANSNFSIGEG
jgi:hypothetical protein